LFDEEEIARFEREAVGGAGGGGGDGQADEWQDAGEWQDVRGFWQW
jgi:hypothetical protein